MLYNGVFGCHGNTCYVNLIGAFFCMIHSMRVPIFIFLEINRYKIDEFRKYAKIVFIWRHVTQKMLRRTSWGLRHQKLWLKQWFSCFRWPWPWPLNYVLFLAHALGMMYWNLHARLHKNQSSINGWYAADTHTHTYLHTPKVILIVSQTRSAFKKRRGWCLVKMHVQLLTQFILEVCAY